MVNFDSFWSVWFDGIVDITVFKTVKSDSIVDFNPASMVAKPSSKVDSNPASMVDTKPSSKVDSNPASMVDTKPSSKVDSKPVVSLGCNVIPVDISIEA